MILPAIIFSLYGGWLYRFRGMATKYKKYLPRPFNQILFALPFALCVPLTGSMSLTFLSFLLVLVATTLGALTGHGGGHDLGTWDKPREDERLEFLIKPLHGKIPEFLYDFLLLGLTGIAITLPLGLVSFNPWMALSGLLKPVGYVFGRMLGLGTGGGEFFTGFLLYLALGEYMRYFI